MEREGSRNPMWINSVVMNHLSLPYWKKQQTTINSLVVFIDEFHLLITSLIRPLSEDFR